MPRSLSLASLLVSIASAGAAGACPVGTVLEVDNDIAGSGYSEDQAQNWIAHNVDACHGTYRYLSHTVGDGTRKGRAIWQPKVTVAGTYSVVTGYRASENRTDDADYILYDDAGGTQTKVVDQRGNGCTKVTIGTAYCAVGGSCRLVLDGTDDAKSDAADVTTFTLVSCDAQSDAGAQNPCSGIANDSAYELCDSSPTSCSGVFTDGSGCQAFCAAAQMVCAARFGGEPGCAKEPQNPIPCDANNGHASDYCECALPAGPADGGAGHSGSAGLAGQGGQAGAAAVGGSGGSSGSGGSASGGLPSGEALAGEDGGCACRAAPSRGGGGPWLGALLLGLLWARRR